MAWRACVEGARDRIVGFCQRVIRAPSLSGHEEQVAQLVLGEMRSLGYDDVQVDGAGNVIGRIAGGGGRSTLLHAHMDVVDPGEESSWSHPPFAGDMASGYLWGRGASDTKGSLAAQVYALGLLREAGLKPAGDTYLAAVVGEELGGFGTAHLLGSLKPGIAIIGEPSSNTLRRAHRGRFEYVVTFRGRAAHASAPARGLNPHYSLARFLLVLREAPMARDSTFGESSVVPTLSYVDQTNSNVIPAKATVHLDWRNAPGESFEDGRALLERVLSLTVEPGVQATIEARQVEMTCYTGLKQALPMAMPGFYLECGHPDLVSAQAILEEALGRSVKVEVWAFTTDGGQLFAAGIPCVGFGPGEEGMAHVVDERLEVEQLLEATVGYMALALEMGKR
jgi:putative selenium metabolism hydrolase